MGNNELFFKTCLFLGLFFNEALCSLSLINPTDQTKIANARSFVYKILLDYAHYNPITDIDAKTAYIKQYLEPIKPELGQGYNPSEFIEIIAPWIKTSDIQDYSKITEYLQQNLVDSNHYHVALLHLGKLPRKDRAVGLIKVINDYLPLILFDKTIQTGFVEDIIRSKSLEIKKQFWKLFVPLYSRAFKLVEPEKIQELAQSMLKLYHDRINHYIKDYFEAKRKGTLDQFQFKTDSYFPLLAQIQPYLSSNDQIELNTLFLFLILLTNLQNPDIPLSLTLDEQHARDTLSKRIFSLISQWHDFIDTASENPAWLLLFASQAPLAQALFAKLYRAYQNPSTENQMRVAQIIAYLAPIESEFLSYIGSESLKKQHKTIKKWAHPIDSLFDGLKQLQLKLNSLKTFESPLVILP